MTRPAGQKREQGALLLGVVEHDQPPVPLPQRARQPPTAGPVGSAGPANRNARANSASPSATNVGSSAGTHQATSYSLPYRWAYSFAVVSYRRHPPVHRLHHRRATRPKRRPQPRQQLLPTGELHRPTRDVPHPPHRHVTGLCPRQPRRVQHAVSTHPVPHRAAYAQSSTRRPERQLPRPCSGSTNSAAGPRHPRRAGTPTAATPSHSPRRTPLRVRHLRLIPHRRPVPEPRDQHVHIRTLHQLAAHHRRRPTSGEVGHVDHDIARRFTADSAAATNDRATGNFRSSEVCDRNTRRARGPDSPETVTTPSAAPTLTRLTRRATDRVSQQGPVRLACRWGSSRSHRGGLESVLDEAVRLMSGFVVNWRSLSVS